MDVISQYSGTVIKWHRTAESRKNFVKKGDKIATILSETISDEGPIQKEVNAISTVSGTIIECFFNIGVAVSIGDTLARVTPCTHPAFFNTMCVSCGDIIQKSSSDQFSSRQAEKSVDNPTSRGSNSESQVTVMTSGRQLQLSKAEADYFEKAKQSGLRLSKKLALVLDLDHTLIHACERVWPATAAENAIGISTISLEESPSSGVRHYLVKFRPFLREFLEKASKICQLSIYTAGTRKYAEGIAKLMDPDNKYFFGRIVSRSDNVSLDGTVDNRISSGMEKSLSRLFLGDTSLAVILDDREDVWRGHQNSQLLLVRPYKYFVDAQEVNNASGITTIVPSAPGGSSQPANKQPSILLSSSPPGMAATNSQSREEDDQLVRSLDIIQSIHTRIFCDSMRPEEREGSSSSVSTVITQMKKAILRGCGITFSGLFSHDLQFPQSHFLWQLAVSFGATVTSDVTPSTTHVICTNISTSKVSKVRNNKNIWILHPDWLFYCRWSMSRALETTFSLIPLDPSNLPINNINNDPNNDPNSDANSEAASPQSDLNKDIFNSNTKSLSRSSEALSYVGAEENDQNSQVFKRARTDDADEKSWEETFPTEDTIQSNDKAMVNEGESQLDRLDNAFKPSENISETNGKSLEADEDDNNDGDDDSEDDDDWDLDEAIKLRADSNS